MENLARYIIRASFSQERMTYLDQEGKVIYKTKDGKSSKSFPALEWMAAMSSHIPNKGEQMVRYQFFFSLYTSPTKKEVLINWNPRAGRPCAWRRRSLTPLFSPNWTAKISRKVLPPSRKTENRFSKDGKRGSLV
jgi:hypothetical protein